LVNDTKHYIEHMIKAIYFSYTTRRDQCKHTFRIVVMALNSKLILETAKTFNPQTVWLLMNNAGFFNHKHVVMCLR